MSSKLRNIDKLAINKQMTLPLKYKSIKNRENYIVSECNIDAVKLIENSSLWQNRKKINSIPGAIIYGPKGSGKTHLCSIFKQNVDCEYLTSLSNHSLEQVIEGRSFILDNFLPGKRYPSELVMHFINQVTYKEGSILLLSRLSPFKMNWKLDDLNSRIRSLISSEIKLPDDVLLYSLIVKYSNEKNLFLSDKKLIYILERLDRSFESVIKLIDKLDIYSLEVNEKVTYKIIRKILDNLNED